MAFRCIDQVDISGKRVFLRVDFNVPLDKNGNISDDTRIQAVLPTLNYALSKKAKIILASHLGRPKGKPEPEFSLAPVSRRLGDLLKKEVPLAPDCIGPEVERRVEALKPGDILLLENLRFHKEEEKNEPGFAQSLAKLAEVYVNDAFAVSHRAHASVEGMTRFFKDKAAGFLMRDELHYLGKVMEDPVRPLVAVIGGAKVSGKLEVLQNLAPRVDKLIIGGGMAFTFLKAVGMSVGKSLVEEDLVKTAQGILEDAGRKGVKVFLPVDCVVAGKMDPTAQTKVVPVDKIPGDEMGMDIGPETLNHFGEALKDWLLRADRSQKELAHVLHVDPSTVTTWVHGQKRPDGLSLVKMLVTFKGWLRGDWNPLEALDAIACLGYDWSRLLEVSVRHFQRGAILNTCGPGGRPLGQRSAGSSCRPGPRFT